MPPPPGYAPSAPPPPGGWGPPPAPSATGYGQSYGAPSAQYGPPSVPGLPAQSAYRPPAYQPGIIPLRPIGLSEILDGAFRAIRHNPRAMFGLSALVVAATGVVEALLIWAGFSWFGGEWLTAPVDSGSSSGSIATFGDVAGILLPILIAGVVFSITTTLLIGLLIIAVSRSVLGTKMTIGQIWQHARPQLWRLLVVTVLVNLLVGAVPLVWAAATIWAGVAEQYAVLGIVGVVGGFGVLVWVTWMMVRTMLATPALMLERLHVIEAVRRSFRLTRGSFWRLLGIYLLATILVGLVTQVISVPLSFLTPVLMTAGGDPATVLAVTTAVSSIVAALISTPFTAAVVALLYIDTRMRREGLDVQLVRAAQEQSL